jgi:U4/U6 small nuclear ribonucleoprotein PRP4
MEAAKKRVLDHLAAQATVVPTAAAAVVAMLRELSEPVKLFGESEPARRERLRGVMAERGVKAGGKPVAAPVEARADKQNSEQFFYPGAAGLPAARALLIPGTLARASKRLKEAKERRSAGDRSPLELFAKQSEQLKRAVNVSAEIGAMRPLSSCAFSDTGDALAVSDWSGAVKVWNGATVAWKQEAAHAERAQHVAWVPGSNRLLSCGADNAVKLWDTGSSDSRTLQGHSQRVNRVVAHPNGTTALSTSYDGTWRMWDLVAGSCLSVQEGHRRHAVYGCAIHPDGALAATTGLDSVSRVWDLRTGCAVLSFKGHVKMVLSCDFSPDGFHLATGSDDNTVRVWDLRKRVSVYSIPAHANCVSHVKYVTGELLVTASFDKSIKAWSGRDFSNVAVLLGHSDRVTYCDVRHGAIASVSFDKSIRIWK